MKRNLISNTALATDDAMEDIMDNSAAAAEKSLPSQSNGAFDGLEEIT